MTNPYEQPQQPYDPAAAGAQQPYQQPYGQPAQPYGGNPNVDPQTGEPLSDKSKMVAGLLQIFAGSFGVGRFYTGHIGIAIAQIAVTWLTCGCGAIWPLIDGIMILTQGGTDAEGRKLKD